MSKGIGRLFSFGLAKETTRGTAISAATYWLPFDDLGFDEKFDNATADQAVGVIENSIGEYRVKNYADGTFKVPMMDQSTGLLFLSLLGSQAIAAHSGESAVYDHKFTVGETAQHQSLTMFIHDPLSGTDYSHANGVVHKTDIDAELKKFVQLSCSARAQKGVAQSSFSPSILSENRFIPQYMAFRTAPTTAGLVPTVFCTGTASSTIHVTALSITTDNLRVGMTVSGTNIPAGTTIATIVSPTAFDMSQASTSTVSAMVIGGLVATATGTSTVHLTALTGITTASLQVGMTVTDISGNVPAGATIAKIVSATAFDLSVATTGALGSSDYLTFGPATIPLKSFKLSIDENLEDQEVLGNVAPADFLNKEFKVEGSLEAIYQNITDFKSQALATPNVASAMLVDLKNTDVTIGAAANPELAITLDQVFFTEYSRPIKVKDLVYQTIKFRCTYSLANSELLNIILTNTVSGAYA